jgi:hypothetical protein
MTMGLKKQTEQVRCQNCNRGNLKFKSAEYADDFNDKKGDIIIVDTVCGFCEVAAPVEVSVF